MCRWLGVSPSGFYEWRSRPLSATIRQREQLKIPITAIFDQSDETYGHRRVHAALARQGERCSVELVRALMRELGLVGVAITEPVREAIRHAEGLGPRPGHRRRLPQRRRDLRGNDVQVAAIEAFQAMLLAWNAARRAARDPTFERRSRALPERGVRGRCRACSSGVVTWSGMVHPFLSEVPPAALTRPLGGGEHPCVSVVDLIAVPPVWLCAEHVRPTVRVDRCGRRPSAAA